MQSFDKGFSVVLKNLQDAVGCFFAFLMSIPAPLLGYGIDLLFLLSPAPLPLLMFIFYPFSFLFPSLIFRLTEMHPYFISIAGIPSSSSPSFLPDIFLNFFFLSFSFYFSVFTYLYLQRRKFQSKNWRHVGTLCPCYKTITKLRC